MVDIRLGRLWHAAPIIALGHIRLDTVTEPEAKARCIMVLTNDAAVLCSAAEEDEAILSREEMGSRWMPEIGFR